MYVCVCLYMNHIILSTVCKSIKRMQLLMRQDFPLKQNSLNMMVHKDRTIKPKILSTYRRPAVISLLQPPPASLVHAPHQYSSSEPAGSG